MALVKGVKNLNGLAHQGDVGLVNLPKSIVSHQLNEADKNTLRRLFGLDPTFHYIHKIKAFPNFIVDGWQAKGEVHHQRDCLIAPSYEFPSHWPA